MAQLWGNLDCMRVLAELFPEQHSEYRPPNHRRASTWIGAAAMVVLAVGLTLGGVFDGLRATQEVPAGHKMPSELVYSTELGEQSEIRLTDGSLLTLNTRSEARIRFDGTTRAVYLSHGEAHFDVASNPQQPFVVYAGQGQVKAVGTAFNVRLVDERVEVVVSEGIVEVLADVVSKPVRVELAEAVPAVVLERGGSAIYTSTITRSEVLPIEKIEQRLAWRQGKWLFEGETLAEVLDEVSRYTDRQIIIADPQLAGLRVGGYFDIGDIDGLMMALEAGFGIRMVRLGDTYRLQAAALTTPES
jgi:transmembrane sensor